jgi:hypothetical protein
VTCENYGGAAITPELVVATMCSGCFATEKGTSSTYTALLTKEDVLNASQQVPTAHSDVKRMVGGGFLDNLKSVFKDVVNNKKEIGAVIKTGLDIHDAYTGKKNNEAARGLIRSFGGARSGGSNSGGSLMSRLK